MTTNLQREKKFTLKKMREAIDKVPIVCSHNGITRDYRCKKCNPTRKSVYCNDRRNQL